MHHILSPNEITEKYNRIIIKTKCKDKETECSICFNPVYMKSVTYLPCTHFFHTNCFNEAIHNKLYTCPLCRFDLTLPLRLLGIYTTPTINETYDGINIVIYHGLSIEDLMSFDENSVIIIL